MAFALPLLVQLFDAIDGTVQWLGGASAPQPQALAHQQPHPQPVMPASRRIPNALNTPAAQPSTQQRAPQRNWGGPTRMSGQRPLRVVRQAEQRRAQAAAGRMMVSGRMTDVCAELDRMAAQENLH